MTPDYEKAARALLGWKQEDLARAAKVSLTAVKNFEKGIGETRPHTLAALRAALEIGGVEFLPGGGVRRGEDGIQSYRFSGKDCVKAHNEMIYAASRTNGAEILTCSPDDALWSSPLARDANEGFKEWRNRFNIRGKTLTAQGNKIFNEPRHQYKFLPPEVIGTITYVIYGTRISFILWKQKKVFVLQNESISDSFRKQFEYLWKIGKPPTA